MASLADLLARVTGRPRTPEPARLVLPPVPTGPDLLAAVDRVETLVADAAVPAAVASRVARVTDVVRQTVPRLDRRWAATCGCPATGPTADRSTTAAPR